MEDLSVLLESPLGKPYMRLKDFLFLNITLDFKFI